MVALLRSTIAAVALTVIGAIIITAHPFPHSLAVGIFCAFVAGAMWQAGLGRRR